MFPVVISVVKAKSIQLAHTNDPRRRMASSREGSAGSTTWRWGSYATLNGDPDRFNGILVRLQTLLFIFHIFLPLVIILLLLLSAIPLPCTQELGRRNRRVTGIVVRGRGGSNGLYLSEELDAITEVVLVGNYTFSIGCIVTVGTFKTLSLPLQKRKKIKINKFYIDLCLLISNNNDEIRLAR